MRTITFGTCFVPCSGWATSIYKMLWVAQGSLLWGRFLGRFWGAVIIAHRARSFAHPSNRCCFELCCPPNLFVFMFMHKCFLCKMRNNRMCILWLLLRHGCPACVLVLVALLACLSAGAAALACLHTIYVNLLHIMSSVIVWKLHEQKFPFRVLGTPRPDSIV